MKRLVKIFVFLGWLAFLSACVSTPPSLSTHRYKLLVSAAGLYRVTGAALQSAGVDIALVDPTTVQIFRGEHELALGAQGEGINLALDFYGQASDSPYSNWNVYWLTWGAQPGKRMREISVAAAPAAPLSSFDAALQLAPVRLYAPQPGDASPSWFWQALDAPMTVTLPITLTAARPGQASVRVNLWGNSQDPVTPNHHLQIFFNALRVADETWDGRGSHSIAAAVPADAVRDGANSVRLVAPNDTGALADLLLLQSIELTYPRRLVAENDSLAFSAGQGAYRVEGFSGNAIKLFDITDPIEPLRLIPSNLTDHAITFQSDGATPRRILALGGSAPRNIPTIVPMSADHLRSQDNQADYVIITHPDFVNALQPLVQWRSQQGLNVRVVTTNEIYDEFNFGNESPLALRAFLQSTQSQWRKPAPRFGLLVGKASYDYRDYLHAPNPNLVPTILIDTPNADKTASDNALVAASPADIRPTIALGRLPAKTPEQVARVVNKIIAYEASATGADWLGRAIFAADDKSAEFAAMSDALAARLPKTIQPHKIYLGEPGNTVAAARGDLIAQWNAGAAMIVYAGHGSVDLWAVGPLFGAAYVDQIRNGERLPLLFTPTCLDGFFYHPWQDSLTEDLLFKSDGGIIAGIVPTGVSFADAQKEFMRALFSELFDQSAPTLGEAFTQAKQKVNVDSPAVREVVETFVLLGDPALRSRFRQTR